MKLIGKYLKPFTAALLACIFLLFAQAMSDLSLPNLMSDIVNVGIQQNGVEAGAPEVISENGLKLLSFFMTQEDKEEIYSAYKEVSASSTEAEEYAEKYSMFKENGGYVLNQLDSEKAEEIDRIYSNSAYAMMLFFQAASEDAADVSDSDTGYSDIDTTTLYSYIPMLEALPAEVFQDSIEAAAQTDSMLGDQIGTTFKQLFYKEAGMELSKLQTNYIVKTGLKMLGVVLIGVAAAILVGFLAAQISGRVSKKLRHDIFEKVESFSNSEFDKFSTASLITRTTNDIQQVQMLIVMGIRMLCYAPIMAVGGVFLALQKSPSLSWIIAVAVIVLIGGMIVIMSIVMPKFKALQKLTDKINLVSREHLSGMMVIRAFGNEPYEEKRFEEANDNLAKTNLFTQRVTSLLMPIMTLIMNFVTIMVVWVGGNAIANSTMQIGDMMAFIQYAMQIIMSFLIIAAMFIFVPRASVAANRIKEVLDTEPAVTDKKDAASLVDSKGVIEFKNVSFRYENAEENVLEDISFVSRPGETTAFIGSTGSGKSTLINLIPRFYDVTGGSIELDGKDIRDIKQEDLRQNIGYVPQKGNLFYGDLKSNMEYGKPDATEEEIHKAIEIAQAEGFVYDDGAGSKMRISQGGTNVSGGQRQRLSIARAVIRKAPVYIFDDSFSALDFKTDAQLRRALSGYTKDSTVLIVAQRVSTIMNAEQIIVLDKGRIVGKGTHKELLKNCGEYREIAENQLQKEELL